MKRYQNICALALASCLLLTGCTAQQDELTALQKRADTLQTFLERNLNTDLAEWDGSYIEHNIRSRIPIYDDTAVIAAHQSGDASALSKKDAQILSAAQAVLKELDVADKSILEKEKAVYDWLIAYKYDTFEIPASSLSEDFTPYGILCERGNKLLAFSTTMKLLLGMMEIESLVVRDENVSGAAWNMVQLEGEWYHVDINGDYATDGKPTYLFFNVDDQTYLNAGYEWNNSYPRATGTKYSPVYQNLITLNSLYQLPQAIKTAREENTELIYVTFEDGSEINYEFFYQIDPYLNDHHAYVFAIYPLSGTRRAHCIRIQENELPTVNQPTYDYERMQKAVDKVFG